MNDGTKGRKNEKGHSNLRGRREGERDYTYHEREPGPNFFGCEFQTAACVMVAVVGSEGNEERRNE